MPLQQGVCFDLQIRGKLVGKVVEVKLPGNYPATKNGLHCVVENRDVNVELQPGDFSATRIIVEI